MKSSVLMSVYHRVNLQELNQCLWSLKAQTRLPDQVVIVIDGPIPNDITNALEEFSTTTLFDVDLVPLDTNGGLTRALNTGLSHCKGEWLFRMDADDISLPDRIETQLSYLDTHADIDLLGTAMWEFSDNPYKPDRLKPTLAEDNNIRASIALRNPINHPTVCVRKRLIEEAGGYPELPLLEDYFLWAKLLLAGAKASNLTTAHYLFRFDDATLYRRGGAENFKNEIWLRRWMHQRGLTSLGSHLLGCTIQVVLRFAPVGIQRWLWHRSRQSTTVELELPELVQP